MAVQIISGATSDILTVDATSKAARASLYDAAGNVLAKADRAAIVPGTQPGLVSMGADYKTGRAIRVSSCGTVRTSDDSLLLYDSTEGATLDSNKWISTVTTMTITQTAATGILFNASAITTTTTGAMVLSHRFMPFVARAGMVAKFRVRATAHSNNNLHEIGFGNPATATTVSASDGAFWRKDGTGQWVPVVIINGSETLGSTISDATFVAAVPTTAYADFEVHVEGTRATFRIFTNAGVVVSEQVVEFTATTGTYAASHQRIFARTYNNTAPASAVQLFVSQVAVFAIDSLSQIPYAHSLAAQSYGGMTSPTAYTQVANYTNNTAPTARTLSNTAAAETTLGGLITANSIAGGATDLIMFGFQVPSPYTFYLTSIRIPPPLNQVAAIATTDTVFSYGFAVNSSAVSLATAAPYAPRFQALGGFHVGIVALAANRQLTGPDIYAKFATPIAVFPSRFLHIICRELVGTATATETYAWNVLVTGYFE
jgi:hypothetical protein